jgi:hypothetical protein
MALVRGVQGADSASGVIRALSRSSPAAGSAVVTHVMVPDTRDELHTNLGPGFLRASWPPGRRTPDRSPTADARPG